jgi:hypothetical protein
MEGQNHGEKQMLCWDLVSMILSIFIGKQRRARSDAPYRWR